jgi:nucleoid-associated protein YgaU
MRAAILTTACVIAALILWSSLRQVERTAPVEDARAGAPAEAALPDVAAAPAAEAPPVSAPADAGATYRPATAAPLREHVVAQGETLADIATRYYGDAARADEIYAANRDRIRDPAQLHAGQTLVIP